MGICQGKCRKGRRDETSDDSRERTRSRSAPSHSRGYTREKNSVIEGLILDSLRAIRSLVENDQEPPEELFKLHSIADQDDGWIQIVNSMVQVVPIDEALGPAVITLLLDDCPLPNKETVLRLSRHFDLSRKNHCTSTKDPRKQRNICIVLGFLAEKLSGPSSVGILTKGTLDFLISNLEEGTEPVVTLFSLIALEKFAQTSENKITIKEDLKKAGDPLIKLEKKIGSENLIEAQVGFCAQWCLDNLFLIEGRKFSYETVDMSNINAMLNTRDVSEYLKISPDGLEARCDAYSFESVRCTFPVTEGVWYYEVTLLSPGVMQIGWATKLSKFLNHEGYGIGDDEYSLAYDGCRELLWHNAKSLYIPYSCWSSGDTVGSLLQIDSSKVTFFLNGKTIVDSSVVFKASSTEYFAGASFMSFQQCRFNFGSRPFLHPPKDIEFKCFNDHASLTDQERIVLPRHLQLEAVRNMSIKEDSCTICFDQKAEVRLEPCGHNGFCKTCALQLTECPMCRGVIHHFLTEPP
ncbi:RING finger and SPRY domain-containing protein 1 [Cimex lectularius]|uniref:RING finger and SPRY domain-containing protein 1 n=1 Tax=Cimex lectularius TaxID=79782 RepID=A0A8I6SBS5_CIMLE|nr:RING finger and SPRY domain-containing protein 1 [Cimex lectularius]